MLLYLCDSDKVSVYLYVVCTGTCMCKCSGHVGQQKYPCVQ